MNGSTQPTGIGIWRDFFGITWPVVTSKRRLRFMYPLHAEIRAHVFHREGFCCVRCGVKAIDVPENYDGKDALFVDRKLASGRNDVLISDHIVTLKAGGSNTVDNMQALCETCNRKKMKEDLVAIKRYKEVD